jgi:hypothetical protein
LNLVPASAATAAAVPTATATAATVTTAPAATAAALRLGAGFVNRQRSAAEFVPIQGGNCLIALGVICHFDKSKAFRLSRIAIGHDVYTIHTAVRFEERTDVLLGSLETEISNKNILHLFSF